MAAILSRSQCVKGIWTRFFMNMCVVVFGVCHSSALISVDWKWRHFGVICHCHDQTTFDVTDEKHFAKMKTLPSHYSDVIMGAMASQITSLTIVYSTVYSDADQRKHQSSASLAFVRGIHRWPVNSPHKWPVTRKMFPFDDIIMSVREPTMCECAIDMLQARGPVTSHKKVRLYTA